MVHLAIEENGTVRNVDLDDGRYLVGRGLDVDLRLESPNVSRRHALIEVDEDRIWVRDLGSLWGTFVDSRRLAEDDRVAVPPGGLVRFAQVELWDHDATRPTTPPVVDLSEETTGWKERRRIDVSELSRHRTLPMLRHLFHLFTTDDESHAIEQEACLFVKNWVDSDRVCLFETHEPGVQPTVRGWWSRDAEERDSIVVSDRLVQNVLETGEAVVWSRDQAVDFFDSDDSRFLLDIHSALAVPIFCPPSIRGVLYVDRRRESADYTDEDIEVLVATASAVAARRGICQSRIDTQKAARIQFQMLPASMPVIPGYELEASLQMCQGVGGDLYDGVCRGDGRCLLTVGDVSGKGLPAALLMGATSFLLRAFADLSLRPLEIYSRVHQNILAKSRAHQYVALFLGELDARSGALDCVVAGLPYPLLIRRDGEVIELESTAFAAALIDLDHPPPTELRVILEPGDLLAVFTDGYPEATPDGQRFLEIEVTEQLVNNRDRPLAEIRDELDRTVDDFVGAAGPSDDRAILLLRRSVDGATPS